MLSLIKRQKKYTQGTEEIVNESYPYYWIGVLSQTDTAQIVLATIESLGHDSQQFVVSRITIRLCQQEFRKERTKLIQQRFCKFRFRGSCCTLGW